MSSVHNSATQSVNWDEKYQEPAAKRRKIGEPGTAVAAKVYQRTPLPAHAGKFQTKVANQLIRQIVGFLFAPREIRDDKTLIFHGKELHALAQTCGHLSDIVSPYLQVARITTLQNVYLRITPDNTFMRYAEDALKAQIRDIRLPAIAFRTEALPSSCFKSLSHLALSYCPDQPPLYLDEGVTAKIAQFPQLKSLDIMGCNLSKLSCLSEAPQITELHTLNYFHLSRLFDADSSVTMDKTFFLSPFAIQGELRKLQAMRIPATLALTIGGLRQIVQSRPNLQVLSIGFNHRLEADEACEVIGALKNLRELTLMNFQITPQSIELLKGLTELRKLSLLSSVIDRQTFETITQTFAQLESLCMPYMEFQLYGERALDSLPKLQNLTELALGFRGEHSELATPILSLKNLQRLYLIDQISAVYFNRDMFQNFENIKALQTLKIDASLSLAVKEKACDFLTAYKQKHPSSRVVINGNEIITQAKPADGKDEKEDFSLGYKPDEWPMAPSGFDLD